MCVCTCCWGGVRALCAQKDLSKASQTLNTRIRAALPQDDLLGPRLKCPCLKGLCLKGPRLQCPCLKGLCLDGPSLQGPSLKGACHKTYAHLVVFFVRRTARLFMRGKIDECLARGLAVGTHDQLHAIGLELEPFEESDHVELASFEREALDLDDAALGLWRPCKASRLWAGCARRWGCQQNGTTLSTCQKTFVKTEGRGCSLAHAQRKMISEGEGPWYLCLDLD